MIYEFDNCRFDSADGRLNSLSSDCEVVLRPQLARLLMAFLDRPGEVLGRDHLCQAIWDEGTVVDFESGLAALMRELRQALDQVGIGAPKVETVPRRGYRLLSSVRPADSSRPPSTRTPVGKIGLGIMLAGLALVILVWLVFNLFEDQSPLTEASPTLAIIPFELHSADGERDQRLQLLLADTVLARLWAVELGPIELVGRTTLKPYHDRQDLASAIAHDLGVDLLLEGTIVREQADQWRVDSRLLAMPQGTVVWSASVAWADQLELPVSATADQLVDELASALPGIGIRH
jgi:DNA-binding winged helix-turn-helix (wHTH) protein/TolB-like protein